MFAEVGVLFPVVTTILLILFTRKTALSLLIGGCTGGLILYWDSLASLPRYFLTLGLQTLTNPWHWSALVFTLLLGGFAALIEANGGLRALFVNTRRVRTLEFQIIAMGFLCFFDGLANSFLIGRVVRPVADRVGLSRQKLAYLADTTGSAIACLAPISTWIAMQLGLISVAFAARGISASPYKVFLQSIPLNFYCLFSIGLAVFLATTGREFFTMRGVLSQRVDLPEPSPATPRVSPRTALIPIGVLIGGIPLFYYLLETKDYFPMTWSKWATALGGSQGPLVFMTVGSLAVLTAFLLSSQLSFRNRLATLWQGMSEMLAPLGVLLCAWIFGGVMRSLGVGDFLAEHFTRHLPLWLYPVCVFLLGCLLSFTTGTSWGTMALLFPLVFESLPFLDNETLLAAMPLLVASIFSGAVFGDHCSPFSDTTILSAIASGISAQEHVRTQFPYAVMAAGAAILLGFLPFGFLLLS